MSRRFLLITLGVWALLILVSLHGRPALPLDETRALTVAWEMQVSGDWLVPHLNGETYSHKPPLLQWLMLLGWKLFGVSAWWARMIGPLAALAMLLLTHRLARSLWPEDRDTPGFAVVILGSTTLWCVMSSMTMYDALLGASALLALLGVVRAARDGAARGFVLMTLGLALGLLAKGPAIFVAVLPVALFAPLWATPCEVRPHIWRRWYLGVLGATLAASALMLLWVVPAVISGGALFREELLWGQTAGRMVQSFAHARPWWWYLALLIPLLGPWSFAAPLWRALRREGRGILRDRTLRLLLIWFVAGLLVFTLTSGKQVHYLLPLFPAMALLFARLVTSSPLKPGDHRLPLLAMLLVTVAAAVVLTWDVVKLPEWISAARPGMAAAFAAVCLITLCARSGTAQCFVMLVAGTGWCLLIGAHLLAGPALHAAYSLEDAAPLVRAAADDGADIAWIGGYHGELGFAARLRAPVAALDVATVMPWLAQHPRALVVLLTKTRASGELRPRHEQFWRGGLLQLWDGAVLAAHPELLTR